MPKLFRFLLMSNVFEPVLSEETRRKCGTFFLGLHMVEPAWTMGFRGYRLEHLTDRRWTGNGNRTQRPVQCVACQAKWGSAQASRSHSNSSGGKQSPGRSSPCLQHRRRRVAKPAIASSEGFAFGFCRSINLGLRIPQQSKQQLGSDKLNIHGNKLMFLRINCCPFWIQRMVKYVQLTKPWEGSVCPNMFWFTDWQPDSQAGSGGMPLELNCGNLSQYFFKA